MPMSISAAGAQSGCSPPTIRYYESIGLLAPAERTAKGRRTYGAPDVARLTFIRRARDFGLSIEQVRDLLAASDGPDNGCAPAATLIEAHLRTIRAQRVELRLLETSLQSMLTRCSEGCGQGSGADCTIFADITDAAGAK